MEKAQVINQKEENGEKKKVDLDKILVEEIGEFGLYQAKTIALAALVAVFVGWSIAEFIFTAARINTRCLILECESRDQQPEFRPSWLANAIPTTGTSFDMCNRFQILNNASSIEEGTCPASIFDQNTLLACEQYVYENTNTVVYDFDLGCDEWRRSIIGTARTFGTLVAHPITGYISDRWGRRAAMTITAFNSAWIGITRYWANTYIGFTLNQFFESAFGFGAFSCAHIISMELVGARFRVAAAATMSSHFALGQLTVALIAWGVPDWRLLTLTLFIPQLVTIAYFWIMSESPRWYMSKGRYQEAEDVLKEAARMNKKELSEQSLKGLRESVEEEKKKTMEGTENDEWLIVQVFRYKPILIRCLVSPIWWITTMCVYYGLSINSVNLVGNMYLNFIAVTAVEIPGFWTAVLLMGRVGRRPVLIGAFWICAICMTALIFIPNENNAASLTVYLIGKYAIATTMTSIHLYTVELYPTKYRHNLFAFSSMMGRIGSVVAPLTPALSATVWDKLPFAMFAALAYLSGALIFVTPETLGSKLPDTMEEACLIGKKTNKDKDDA